MSKIITPTVLPLLLQFLEKSVTAIDFFLLLANATNQHTILALFFRYQI